MATEIPQRQPSQSGQTTLIIVDSQVIFRMGVRRVLAREGGIDVMGETDNLDDAISMIEDLSPQVLMVDADLSPSNGLEVTELVHRRYPAVSVIVMSQEIEDQQIFQAMRAGAVAAMSKSAPVDEMVSTISRISNGDLPIADDLISNPNLATLVQDEFRLLDLLEETPRPMIAPLADKEAEALSRLAQGEPEDEIASNMRMTPEALHSTVSSVLIKLARNKHTLDTVASRVRGRSNTRRRRTPPKKS